MFSFLFFTYFNFILSSLLQLCVTHWLWCAWVRSVCSWLYKAGEVSPTDKTNLLFPGFSQIILSLRELDDGIDITQETRRWKLKVAEWASFGIWGSGAPGLTWPGFGTLLVANNSSPVNRFMWCFPWDDFSQLLQFVRGAHKTAVIGSKKWLHRSQESSFNYF